MKYAPIFLVLCIAAMLPLHGAETKPSTQLLKELVECLEQGQQQAQADLDAAPAEDSNAKGAAQSAISKYSRALDSVRMLQSEEVQGSWDRYSRSISGISYISQSFPGECAALYVELNRAVEREFKEAHKQLERDIETFRRELGDVLVTAERPDQLDRCFVDLESLKKRIARFGSRSHNYQSSMNDLSQILTGWQDYLNFRAVGDLKQAESSLRNLNRSLSNTPIVPRSVVLNMQNQLKYGPKAQESNQPTVPYTLEAVVDSIQAVEDLEPAETKLEALLAFRETKNEAQRQIQSVRHLLLVLDFIESGNPSLGLAQLNWPSSRTDRYSLWHAELVVQIRRKAFYQIIPEHYRPEIENTGIEALIAKSAVFMKEAGDWSSIWELLKVVKSNYLRNNSQGTLPSIDNDIRAIERYLYAVRLEETGQLAKALSTYNSVISVNGTFGPYEEAKQAIINLRESRADELLQDQERIAKIPPVQSPSRYYPGMRHYGNPMSRDSEELAKAVERAVAEQLAVYMATKAKAEKTSQESEKEAAKQP